MNIKEYCVDTEISVRDAMRKVNTIKPQIVFLIKDNKLIASLSDGDIRRFLLNGGDPEDNAVNASNRSPKIAENKVEACATYHKEPNLKAIPIINSKREIADIYIGNSTNYEQLGIPVVINAGGRGTRLDPYTKILPKPLIPVGERPIIEHIMHQFLPYGCDNFHVIVNYKKQLIKAYFNENEEQYKVAWYDEVIPLGTGGGLSLLKNDINETFFFSNCDVLLKTDYDCILDFHRQQGNVITMVCALKNLIIPYGVIDMGKNGTILGMREKPEMSFLTNTGIYIVEPEVIKDIKDDTCIGFPDIIEQQRQKGNKTAVYPVSEDEWLDMGQLSELEKMREKIYGE